MSISNPSVQSANTPLSQFSSNNTVDEVLLSTTSGTAITTGSNINGSSSFYIDPSSANPGRRVFLRTSAGNLTVSDSAIVEQWNMNAPGGASSTFSYNSNSHTQNNTGNQDCTPNCKTYSPGEVHLMGTISKSIDTINGGVTLYGTEARVDSLGSNSASGANHKGQRYIGGVMVATWNAGGSGGHFGAQVHGEESLTQICTDSTFATGENTGLRAGFVNRPGLGGDPNARIAFLDQDPNTTSYIHNLSAPGLNTVTSWAASTVYAQNALVVPTLAPTGLLYKMTTVGGCTSGTHEPGTFDQGGNEWPFSSGGTITEPANGGNQCVWQEVRMRMEAFGKGATAGSSVGFDLAVGDGSTATGGASVAIGAIANCTHSASQCYGEGATDTASNQVVVGSNGAPALHYYYGRGVTNATPNAIDLQGSGGSGTNVAGTSVVWAPGFGTGNAVPSQFNINGPANGGGSGTTAQTQVLRVGTGWSKVLTNNTTTTVSNVTDASNTTSAVNVSYAVEIFDGTNLQYEVGMVSCGVINKAGVFGQNTCTKYGTTQGLGSGTLTVTWSITGANPALLQINSNSSLTTTVNRVTYNIENLTQQAVTIA